MSKVAIICDTHAGIKNGSDVFLDYTERFYQNVFFPKCEELGIKRVLHLGDYFDHRKFVNLKVVQRNRQMFIEEVAKRGMEMDIIPGNHDVYWKNTNDLCTLTEQLSHYPFINIHMDPTILDIDGLKIAMLPWLTADNRDSSMDFIQTANAPILMGHLELAGFKYIAGTSILSHGMDAAPLKRFEMVLSGHYHSTSNSDNIRYLGAPFELTWSDADDPKYFHILDTDTRALSRVRNPHRLFRKLYYDDSQGNVSLPKQLKTDSDVFVKVIVKGKKDPFLFDKYMEAIQSVNPLEVKIVEVFDGGDSDIDSDETASALDTTDLLSSYVDGFEIDLDKNRLKKQLLDLFIEAQSVDTI